MKSFLLKYIVQDKLEVLKTSTKKNSLIPFNTTSASTFDIEYLPWCIVETLTDHS